MKRTPHQSIPPVLAGRDIDFIGSHPMAGSERTGLAAATADLFQDAACLLTNDEHASRRTSRSLGTLLAKRRLPHLLDERGGPRRTGRPDQPPAPHPCRQRRAHLPEDPAEGRFGGGGLRDTTRVASGNAEMWAEILIENREALLDPLRETIADLGSCSLIWKTADQQPARQWLATAKHQRDLLQPPC